MDSVALRHSTVAAVAASALTDSLSRLLGWQTGYGSYLPLTVSQQCSKLVKMRERVHFLFPPLKIAASDAAFHAVW